MQSTDPAKTLSRTSNRTVTVGERGLWADVLKTFLGKTVTVVNPESYEEAPVGHQIRAGFYQVRPIAMGLDYLVVTAEMQSRRSGTKETVRQYIPFAQIKRVSVMKNERILHL